MKELKFSKKIVIFCIAIITIYTCLQTYLSYELSVELSPTLTTCVYTFFGTELAATALIHIFDKKKEKDKSEDKEVYEDPDEDDIVG